MRRTVSPVTKYRRAHTGNSFPHRKVFLPEPSTHRQGFFVVGDEAVQICFLEADSPQAAPRRQLERILRPDQVVPLGDLQYAAPLWVIDPERS